MFVVVLSICVYSCCPIHSMSIFIFNLCVKNEIIFLKTQVIQTPHFIQSQPVNPEPDLF